MKALKLLALSVIVAIVMAVSWVVGTMLGNGITSSAPPPPVDVANAGLIFIAVCAFDSILITTLLLSTERFRGNARRLCLILFVFGIQHLLPQMETLFFASGMGISYGQAVAILIAGIVSSVITVLIAEILYDKIIGTGIERLSTPVFPETKVLLIWMAVLVLLVYPGLYLTFGYFIAWQNENLRVYYTSSSELAPFFEQTINVLVDGTYAFQVLRGVLWILFTVPVVMFLKGSAIKQYLVVAVLCALLPTSLLFIPNPYMPEDIAMTHFVETSTSNFVWGLAMVVGIKNALKV